VTPAFRRRLPLIHPDPSSEQFTAKHSP
jgi:hypothetical protein